MITVILDFKNPKAIIAADGFCEQVVSDFIEEYNKIEAPISIVIGTDVLFNYFRLAVRKKLISHESIKFKTPTGDITLLPNGKTHTYPNDYTSYWEESLLQLM